MSEKEKTQEESIAEETLFQSWLKNGKKVHTDTCPNCGMQVTFRCDKE